MCPGKKIKQACFIYPHLFLFFLTRQDAARPAQTRKHRFLFVSAFIFSYLCFSDVNLERIMIYNERDVRHEHVLAVARQMMTAARTAPKGKGIDVVEVALVTDEDLGRLADEMRRISDETGMKFFLRDADNVLQAECVVIIGTREQAQGLNCGHCGFDTCEARSKGVPCALNSIDVGIAVGSACATAADCRVDTRVMFSAGLAAQRLEWLPGCRSVLAIPVSAASKNPFFDRKPKL